MRKKTGVVYSESTGEILRVVACREDVFEAQAQEGERAIEHPEELDGEMISSTTHRVTSAGKRIQKIPCIDEKLAQERVVEIAKVKERITNRKNVLRELQKIIDGQGGSQVEQIKTLASAILKEEMT